LHRFQKNSLPDFGKSAIIHSVYTVLARNLESWTCPRYRFPCKNGETPRPLQFWLVLKCIVNFAHIVNLHM